MKVDALLELLRAHSAVLQSPTWSRNCGPSAGPALYLDLDDTKALIAELTRLKFELGVYRSLRRSPMGVAFHGGAR